MNDSKEVQEIFDIFTAQFGENDIYRQILLEVLMEELLEKEPLCQNQESGSI